MYHFIFLDDDENSRTLFERIMSQLQQRHSICGTMSEVRKILCSSSEKVVFISDWHMPEIDGIDAIITLRDEFSSTIVFTILLTAADDSASLAKGVDAIVSKSSMYDALVQLVKKDL